MAKERIPAKVISKAACTAFERGVTSQEELSQRLGVAPNKARHLVLGHPTNIARYKATALLGSVGQRQPVFA